MQKKIKNVGIFTPFPSIIGGGERYIFTIASVLENIDCKVEFLSPFNYDLASLVKIFGLSLKRQNFTKTTPKDFFLPRLKRSFDLFFSLSNHIIPPVFGFGEKNILIIQFPFPFSTKKIANKFQSLIAGQKLNSYQKIICYSKFSKDWITRNLHLITKNEIPVEVIYPSVDPSFFSLNKKEKKNYILSVGRFFKGDHNKKHEDLIETFKKLISKANILEWEYHIAGYLNNDKESLCYFQQLKEIIQDYPIFLHPNIDRKNLLDLYSKSKIFWHGTGYNNNEKSTPEKSEHFGIVVIEAMAAGLVPLVANSGALPEIIENSKNGYLWNSLDELYKLSLRLINNEFCFTLANNSVKRSRNFGLKNFTKNLLTTIKDV